MRQRLFIIVISLSLFFSVSLTTIIRAETKGVEVVEGPIVLHANIVGQWGGHTFCYLLQVNELCTGQQTLTTNNSHRRR